MRPLDIESVRRRLPGRRIDWHPLIDSTMYAAAGHAPGTAVVADAQTAGQGRYGRTWHSEPAAGLYCSIVLRPVDASPIVTLALGLATAEAIARITDLRCDLRWPNDLMLPGEQPSASDRKVAGILVQASGSLPVVGIGINVNQESFPPDVAQTATSLRLALGREVSREDLLAALLPSVDGFCKMLEEAGKKTILNLFTRCSSYASGKRVVVDQPEGQIRGVTAGLDASGFLRVRRDDGSMTLILAGGVRAAGS